MFNPTVIRITIIDNFVGMVLDNLHGDDYYFQVYETFETGHTQLVYTMPWGSQVKALKITRDG